MSMTGGMIGGARALSRTLPVLRLAAVLGLVAALGACEPFDDPGGGGGGGGAFSFIRGFAFIRDNNVYLSNESDGYQRVSALTTEGSSRTPVISPDGRLVAFVRVVGNETELRVVPVTGGASSVLISSAGLTRRNFRLPVFTPDSGAVLYVFDEGGRSVLAQINSDGSNDVRLDPVATDTRSYTSPSFSRTGTLLVAGGFSPSQYDGLYSFDRNSGVTTQLLATLGTPGLFLTNRVVISPDGVRAAFDARTSNTASRIFVAELGTADVKQLTDTVDGSDEWPTWVGSARVGFSSASGGADQVYVLDASLERTSGGLTVPSAFQPSYGPN